MDNTRPGPGTNYFGQLNNSVKISLTDDFNLGMEAECNGNPNVVATDANIFNVGCKMTRKDILSGSNVYFNTGTRQVPTWTLAGGGSGSVTSVTGTTPIIIDNTNPATPIVTIQVANATQSGYLTSTDWNTFNNKQGAITLTTTGSSGVATFSGGTLNIPNYVTPPGGLNLQVQYNNGGVFGGISGAVTNGTILNLTNPLIGGATITTSTVNGVTLVTGGTSTLYLSQDGTYTTPAGGGTSYWTPGTNPNDITNTNSGNVGINTVAPVARFQVNAATTTLEGLRVQTTDDNTTKGALTIANSSGTPVFTMLANGNLQNNINGTFSFLDFSGNVFLSKTNTGVVNLVPGIVGGAVSVTPILGGGEKVFNIMPQINYSGASDYTALNVDVTENSTPTGARILADLSLGGVSKFRVEATGDVTIAAFAGTGTRMVVANSAGLLSTQSIPSGTVTSVSGTTNRITSTGGATPVIDISATYVGQSSITTLGTITTGVWNGTDIAFANITQVGANTVLTNPTAGTADISTTSLALSQLLGRGSTGDVAAITLGAGLAMTGTTLSATGSGGTVTSVASADGSITVTNPTSTVDLAVVKSPKWTTARNLAGNSVDGSANVAFANKFIVQGTSDTGLSGAQFLGALATGYVKNTTTTGVLSTVTTIPASDISSGAALTKVDDTNVTLTLGGTPATALLVAASLSLGWTGTLAPSRGGTGIASLGTGIATWLGTPSSANLAAAMTDETGSGSLVFGTAPTITLASASTAVTQTPADNSTKIATTAYVDAAVNSTDFKEACLVATTANLVGVYLNGASGVGATFTYTATGTNTIDGVTLALGNRVLVKNQSTTFQNGIYAVTTAGALGIAGVLTRTADFNEATDIDSGDTVFVSSGTAGTSTTWTYNGVSNPVMGTNPITFVQISGPGSITSGNGITVTGLSIAIDTSVTVDKTTAQALTNKTYNGITLSGTGSLANSGTSALTSFTGSGTSSGTNTGDQTITLSGAVTGSGTTTITTTFATPGTLTVATTNSNANAHTHAITSSSAPGAAASLLATDASGIIGSTGTRIVKGWFTDLTVTNAIAGSITGNAATVTTNANLTGVITSVGNATSIALQTGTGTKFVMDTTPTIASPTLTTPVINGTSTGTGVATASTASTLALRDANANISTNNVLEGYATTATAAGTTVLTVASAAQQFFTGSTTQTVTLPVTSTLVLGFTFEIVNNSTGAVTINSSGANVVVILAAGTSVILTCILTTGTTAASWNAFYQATVVTTNKKLSVIGNTTLNVGDITFQNGSVLTVSASTTIGGNVITFSNTKTFTLNNSIAFSGTDSTTMTFPTTNATLARTDAAQTFTGVQTFNTPIAASSVATMTATVGGGVPTPPNNTTTFLRGDGTFATPTSSGVTFSAQSIPLVSGTTLYTKVQMTSDLTGTVMFIAAFTTNSIALFRLLKDTITTNYYVTHKTTLALTGTQQLDGICVLGSFVYVGADNNNVGTLTRYAIADLTGVTTMTVSGTNAFGGTDRCMWADATQIYVMNGTSGTFQPYTISGTTATSGTTIVFTSSGNPAIAAISNGTNVWISDVATGGTITIRKYVIAGGAVVSTTSPIIQFDGYPNGIGTGLFMGSSSILGIGWIETLESNAIVKGTGSQFIGITLP